MRFYCCANASYEVPTVVLMGSYEILMLCYLYDMRLVVVLLRGYEILSLCYCNATVRPLRCYSDALVAWGHSGPT